jgi:hypothetical protein
MSSCNHTWVDQLSLDRYRPMLRLLSSRDMEFLRACPGCTPRQIRKLRARRVRILREYLRSLAGDFRGVSRATRVLVANSPTGRSRLAIELFHREWRFSRSLAAVRIRLVLYRWGLAEVDPGSLLSLFHTARLRLRDLVPSAL